MALPPSGSSSSSSSSSGPLRLEEEILIEVNHFRNSEVHPPLRCHPALAKEAFKHASAVASGKQPFSHEGAQQRFEACGLAPINVAENLARSDGYPREDLAIAIVRGWCDSPGHRRNLLGPFNVCGLGFSSSDSGVIFVTQLLALIDDDVDWRGRMKVVAQDCLISTPAITASVGLCLSGPGLALVGAVAGAAAERRWGVKFSAAPQMLQDRAATWLQPPRCACCGDTTSELFATSWPDSQEGAIEARGGRLLCGNCHPAPDNEDNWCYLP